MGPGSAWLSLFFNGLDMVGVDAVLLGDWVHNPSPFWAKVLFQVSQWKLQDLKFQILIKKKKIVIPLAGSLVYSFQGCSPSF